MGDAPHGIGMTIGLAVCLGSDFSCFLTQKMWITRPLWDRGIQRLMTQGFGRVAVKTVDPLSRGLKLRPKIFSIPHSSS